MLNEKETESATVILMDMGLFFFGNKNDLLKLYIHKEYLIW